MPSSSFRYVAQVRAHDAVEDLQRTLAATPPFAHSLLRLSLICPTCVKTSTNVTFSYLDLRSVSFLPLIDLLAEKTSETNSSHHLQAQSVPTAPNEIILNPWWTDPKGNLNIATDQDTFKSLGLRGQNVTVRKNAGSKNACLITMNLKDSIGGIPLFSPLLNATNTKPNDIISKIFGDQRLHSCSRVAALPALGSLDELNKFCKARRVDIPCQEDIDMNKLLSAEESGIVYSTLDCNQELNEGIMHDEAACRDFIDGLGWAVLKGGHPRLSLRQKVWNEILFDPVKTEEIIKSCLIPDDYVMPQCLEGPIRNVHCWICLTFQTLNSGDSVIILIRRNPCGENSDSLALSILKLTDRSQNLVLG